MKRQHRIELTDSPINMMAKLAEGNPGALTVLMQLYKDDERIDKDSGLGPFGSLLALDSYGIYGSSIWVLYKDICGESVVNTIAVLRAVQLGFLATSILQDAVSRQDRSGASIVPVNDLLLQVKERLENFDRD